MTHKAGSFGKLLIFLAKKIAIWLIILFFLLLLLVQAPSLNRPILTFVLNEVGKAKNLNFHIKKVSGSLPFDITLYGLKVSDKQGLCAHIEKIDLTCNGGELLFGKKHLSKIKISALTLHRIPEDFLIMDEEPIRFPDLTIDHFSIDALKIPFLFQGPLGLEAKLISMPNDLHDLRVFYRLDSSAPPVLLLKYTQHELNYKLSLQLQESFQSLKALFPEQSLPQGTLTLQGQMAGKSDFISFNADLKGDIKGGNFPAIKSSPITFKAILNKQGSSLSVEGGKISVERGPWATFSYHKKEQTHTGELQACSLPLNQWVPGLPKEAKNLSGTMEMKMEKDSYQLKLHFPRFPLKMVGNHVTTLLNWETILNQNKSGSQLLSQWKNPYFGANIHVKFQEDPLTYLKNSQIRKLKDILQAITLKGPGVNFSCTQLSPLLHRYDLMISDALPFSTFLGYPLTATVKSTLIEKSKDNLSFKGNLKNLRGPQGNLYISTLSLIGEVQNGKGQATLNGETPWGKISIQHNHLAPKNSPSGQWESTTKLLPTSLRFIEAAHPSQKIQGIMQGELKIFPNNRSYFKFNLNNLGLWDVERKKIKYLNLAIDIEQKLQEIELRADILGRESLLNSTKLSLRGKLSLGQQNLSPNAPPQMELTGQFDLSFLNGLYGWDNRHKGILQINGIFRPRQGWSGTLSLKNGQLENAAYGTILKSVSLKGRLEKYALLLDTLRAEDHAKGSFFLKGYIGFDEHWNSKTAFKLKFNNFMIANTDEVTLQGSGDFGINTQDHELFIKGDMTIHQGLVSLKNRAHEPSNIRLYRTTTDLQQKEKKKYIISGPQLDLQINIPKNLFIQGYGLHSEWAGNLQIKGRTTQPIVNGSLKSTKGYLDVANKRLSLEPSDLSFGTFHDKKGDHLLPLLNLRASKVVGEYQTFVVIQGNSQDPKILFLSQPALSTEEVIALILFNKPLSTVSAAQTLQLATALATLKAGTLSGGPFESLGQILGVDEIGFQNSNKETIDNPDEMGPTSLRIGKQLNDRVYAAIDQGLDDRDQTKALLQIEVTPRTKIELETGTQESAAGLSWEKRY